MSDQFVYAVQRIAEVNIPDHRVPLSIQYKKDIVISFEKGERTAGSIRV